MWLRRTDLHCRDIIQCYNYVACNNKNDIILVLPPPVGLTPAHVATKEASIDVLKFLFQMGANKNAPVS